MKEYYAVTEVIDSYTRELLRVFCVSKPAERKPEDSWFEKGNWIFTTTWFSNALKMNQYYSKVADFVAA